jgi:tRNA (guanine-N7-)-methyltransferase
MAQADAARDYLAVEAHIPGVASLLLRLEQLGQRNVAVAVGDAIDLLRDRIAPGSLDAVHAFFPDPWPKTRHHKRRLVQPDHVALIRSRLRTGGSLHCATDWQPYADEMLATFEADGGLTNAFGGFAPRPADRPVTKFERRAIVAGRPVVDVLVTRT